MQNTPGLSWLRKALKELREEAGLSPYSAGRRAGVQHSSVLRWESGETVPRVDLLQRVLSEYGYEIELVKKDD